MHWPVTGTRTANNMGSHYICLITFSKNINYSHTTAAGEVDKKVMTETKVGRISPPKQKFAGP